MYKSIAFVFLITVTEMVFGGCGEEDKTCYRYVNGKVINKGSCKVIECANMSGGMQEWSWKNGDSVKIDVRDEIISVNGKIGYSFSQGQMFCYGIGNQSQKNDYVCSSDDNEDHPESKKGLCFKILGAGMYNGILEDICGFSEGVKNQLKKMYASGNCQDLITQDEIKQTSNDVLEDTRVRYSALGKESFCDENKKSYYDLVDD